MTDRSADGCRSCGAILRHTVVDLGVCPLANSYLSSEQLAQSEPRYPLQVFVCDECLLVQLKSVVRPEDIFSEYAYFSSYANSWIEHARAYCEAVTERFGLNGNSHVVEIASNDGYLLQFFLAKGLRVLGIEPAANVAQAAIKKGVPTRVCFFNEDAARDLVAQRALADLIVANNVLAHVPDLKSFVRGLELLLVNRGVVTLEFPHLMRLIQENQFDTIYHEHLSYFSLIALQRVFDGNGLRIFDVEELPTHGGSLRVYACHDNDESKAVQGRVRQVIVAEHEAGLSGLSRYFEFGRQIDETKRKLCECLVRIKQQKKSVAAYGAPAKGNTLLNYCGLGKDLIDYTVDRSPHKQGRFLPGTHIEIYSPERIDETKPDYVLILPWNLKHEIMEQMRHIRQWGGQFIVPIPELEIV
jgi:hypothetical protein